jgi:hypothetical protein
VWLVDPATGVVREAKVVTGVEDCSRYCVSARMVERATGRQVCLAFAQALIKFGIPDEVLAEQWEAVHRPVSARAGTCCSTRSGGITASRIG